MADVHHKTERHVVSSKSASTAVSKGRTFVV